MALIESVTTNNFDTTAILTGDCIRAKRGGWPAFRNGFITEVTDTSLTCLYSTDSGNTVNYFTVSADEVAAGLWQIYWTTDFVTVNSEGVTTNA